MEAVSHENWKNINGFDNYEISRFGIVRNATTERILTPIGNRDGYLRVGMQKNSKRNLRMIHVLLANAFIENPHNKPCVDHIDGNRQNNCLENLRFATRAENSRNKSKSANTTSVYYGVCFHKKSNKWNAQIQIDGRRKNLGYFTDEKEAAAVFNKAAAEFYKEFRKINVFED